MKKLIIFLATGLLMILSVNAADLKANYYVLSTGEINNCRNVQFKANEIRIVLENGEKLIISKSEIKAIKVNGKYYEKLPVYENNKPTNQEEFMEFVATRGGLKLYKYRASISDNRSKGFNEKAYEMDYYVVFRGDQYWVEVNDINYPTLFNFFRVRYTEK